MTGKFGFKIPTVLVLWGGAVPPVTERPLRRGQNNSDIFRG